MQRLVLDVIGCPCSAAPRLKLVRTDAKAAALKTTEIRPWSSHAALAQSNRYMSKPTYQGPTVLLYALHPGLWAYVPLGLVCLPTHISIYPRPGPPVGPGAPQPDHLRLDRRTAGHDPGDLAAPRRRARSVRAVGRGREAACRAGAVCTRVTTTALLCSRAHRRTKRPLKHESAPRPHNTS